MLLILLGCSNSLSGGSILIDADRGAKCLEFQYDYMSNLFKLTSVASHKDIKQANV
jgi:hypothetical protein